MRRASVSFLVLSTVVAVTAAGAGCGAGDPGAGGDPGPELGGGVATGALEVSVAAASAAIAGFQIDVATAGGARVSSQFVAVSASASGGPRASAFITLLPGAYTVSSTPMHGPGRPAPECAAVSAPVLVARGRTAEVMLTARCTAGTGAVGVTVDVDFEPVVTFVGFEPSRTVAPCEGLAVSAQAVDPEGKPVTYAFAVTATPAGAGAGSFTLDVTGSRAVFAATVAGDYALDVRACDARGCGTLSVPLHVAGAAPGGACTLTCDDANPCTADTRDAAGLCGHATVADGTLCTGGKLRVKILGFNDFHGQVEEGRRLGTRPVGGAAVLASYLEAAQAGIEDQTLIVHAGDFVGASPPASALLQDEPSIQFLNLLANGSCSYANKLDPACNVVGTFGNHEFDEGRGELLRLIGGGNFTPGGPFLEDPYRGARFPYVSANVVDQITRDPIVPPFIVKKVKGVPIAVVGAVLKGTPTIVTPSGVASLSFLDEADAINAQIPAIQSLGVHAVVVTIHQGGFQTSYNGPTNPAARLTSGPEIQDIINRLDDEVDVVVSGHTHAFSNFYLANAHGKQILVTQAFSSSTAYGDIDLLVDPVTRDVVSKSAQIVTTFGDVGPGLRPDPVVAAMVAQATSRVAPLVSRVVGFANGAFTRVQNAAGESTLGDLIADAQRAAMGTTFAFMNPGGIRDDLNAGDITWGELFAIQPFGNTLVRMKLTGAQIYQVLEQQWLGQTSPRIMLISGFDYTWNPALPVGGRVVEVRVGGVAIDRAATYTVTCNNFMATGGDGFTTFIAGTEQIGGPVDLDALIDYVEARSPITPALDGRVRNP